MKLTLLINTFMLCKFCNTETNNPLFCSRSCAAKHNNVSAPKRKRSKHCKRCQAAIASSRTYCSSCWKQMLRERPSETYTLAQYVERLSVKGKHPSWQFANIRLVARNWHRMLLTHCQVCGYSKHVEVAHIKPVASFPLTATLREVNDRSNIAILCRNCHWEFDNGFIPIESLVAPA